MDDNKNNDAPGTGEYSTVKAPCQPYLEVIFGVEKGKRRVLDRDRIVVGRGEEADFILDDATVSRRHLKVERAGDGYRIKDLGGSNGTRVGGEKIAEATISQGSTIEIGSTVLTLEFGDGAAKLAPDHSVRNMDTQELPALGTRLGRPDPANGEPPRQPTQPMMKQREGSQRTRIPSPLLSQVVSWLVILCVATGGILLLLKLLEGGTTSFFYGGDGGAAQTVDKKPRAVPNRRTSTPEPRSEPETILSEIPIANTPDVAMEKFQLASKHESQAQFTLALEVLEEIAEKYPELTPPSGTPVPEKMDQLKKTIFYRKTVEKARELLERPAPTGEELQELIVELDAIPTTDGQFGEEAMMLSERAKSKMRKLALGLLPTEEPDVQEEIVEEQPPPHKEAEPVVPRNEKKEPADRDEDQKEGKKSKSPAEYLDAARGALDEGSYGQARKNLERARKMAPGNPDVKKLENLFSLEFSKLMKKAAGEENRGKAIVLLEQALTLARKGSPQAAQADKLKKDLASSP